MSFFILPHRWIRLVHPRKRASAVELGNKVPLQGLRKRIGGRTWVIVDQQRGHGLPEDEFEQAVIEGVIALTEAARTHEETTPCTR